MLTQLNFEPCSQDLYKSLLVTVVGQCTCWTVLKRGGPGLTLDAHCLYILEISTKSKYTSHWSLLSLLNRKLAEDTSAMLQIISSRLPLAKCSRDVLKAFLGSWDEEVRAFLHHLLLLLLIGFFFSSSSSSSSSRLDSTRRRLRLAQLARAVRDVVFNLRFHGSTGWTEMLRHWHRVSGVAFSPFLSFLTISGSFFFFSVFFFTVHIFQQTAKRQMKRNERQPVA